jgi:hypothetical protein
VPYLFPIKHVFLSGKFLSQNIPFERITVIFFPFFRQTSLIEMISLQQQ